MALVGISVSTPSVSIRSPVQGHATPRDQRHGFGARGPWPEARNDWLEMESAQSHWRRRSWPCAEPVPLQGPNALHMAIVPPVPIDQTCEGPLARVLGASSARQRCNMAARQKLERGGNVAVRDQMIRFLMEFRTRSHNAIANTSSMFARLAESSSLPVERLTSSLGT